MGPYLRYDEHCTVLVVTKYGPRSIFQHVWNSGIGSVGEILFVSAGSWSNAVVVIVRCGAAEYWRVSGEILQVMLLSADGAPSMEHDLVTSGERPRHGCCSVWAACCRWSMIR